MPSLNRLSARDQVIKSRVPISQILKSVESNLQSVKRSQTFRASGS